MQLKIEIKPPISSVVKNEDNLLKNIQIWVFLKTEYQDVSNQ